MVVLWRVWVEGDLDGAVGVVVIGARVEACVFGRVASDGETRLGSGA